MDCRLVASLLVAFVVAASPGCRDAPLAENVDLNMSPTAFAGVMQTVEYDGSPVTVTLDGSGSTDPDGTIETYRWFSGNAAPDGGVGRIGPDPDDVMSPKVTLDRGTWAFTLFVIDNDGGTSVASTVTIMVGGAVITPEATECAAGSLQTIAEDCRLCLCSSDEVCRAATTGCDQGCWDFYTCVATKCGGITDMTALADCVRANCADFFGGVGKYMMLLPCIDRDPACRDTCSDSVQTM
jgi:hypothetical protein